MLVSAAVVGFLSTLVIVKHLLQTLSVLVFHSTLTSRFVQKKHQGFLCIGVRVKNLPEY